MKESKLKKAQNRILTNKFIESHNKIEEELV